MTPIDIFLLSGAVVIAVMASMKNELTGGYRLLSRIKEGWVY